MTRKVIQRSALDRVPDGAELLTVNEAAVYVRVSRRTIYDWINSDKIQVVRIPSGSMRVIKASLIAGNSEAPAREPGPEWFLRVPATTLAAFHYDDTFSLEARAKICVELEKRGMLDAQSRIKPKAEWGQPNALSVIDPMPSQRLKEAPNE